MVGVALMPPDAVAKWAARAGVVAVAVEDRIDALLGKEMVLRQQALDAIRMAENDIVRLEELAVSSRVDAKLLDEKLSALQAVEALARQQSVSYTHLDVYKRQVEESFQGGSSHQPAPLSHPKSQPGATAGAAAAIHPGGGLSHTSVNSPSWRIAALAGASNG